VPAAVDQSFRVSPGISATTTTTEASIPARSIVLATGRPPVAGDIRAAGELLGVATDFGLLQRRQVDDRRPSPGGARTARSRSS
jgi:hypothetical protein